jgi:hypothetical protein
MFIFSLDILNFVNAIWWFMVINSCNNVAPLTNLCLGRAINHKAVSFVTMEKKINCSWNIKTHYLHFKHFIITITALPRHKFVKGATLLQLLITINHQIAYWIHTFFCISKSFINQSWTFSGNVIENQMETTEGRAFLNMVFLTTMLTTADVNIHASNRQIWYRHPNKEIPKWGRKWRNSKCPERK